MGILLTIWTLYKAKSRVSWHGSNLTAGAIPVDGRPDAGPWLHLAAGTSESEQSGGCTERAGASASFYSSSQTERLFFGAFL